uniref:uncharacterized protein n=1 Tax=Pristiophorus japonicus TaxID=55135 RepID=UPI00398E38F2
MYLPVGLAMLLVTLAQCKRQQTSEHWRWNYRDGADKVNINGVHSVTRLLDHWGNRIFKQVKDTMISKPQDVLPDYSRIQPLSEALGDLFKEVRSLKKRLGILTESLTGLEKVFTQVGYGKPVKIKRVVMKKVPRKTSKRTPYQTPYQISIRTPNQTPIGTSNRTLIQAPNRTSIRIPNQTPIRTPIGTPVRRRKPVGRRESIIRRFKKN